MLVTGADDNDDVYGYHDDNHNDSDPQQQQQRQQQQKQGKAQQQSTGSRPRTYIQKGSDPTRHRKS